MEHRVWNHRSFCKLLAVDVKLAQNVRWLYAAGLTVLAVCVLKVYVERLQADPVTDLGGVYGERCGRS